MLHFYDVGGQLVRRWVPGQRRLAMEVWNGDGWAPFPDVDSVSRHGARITDAESLALLLATRQRVGTFPALSEEDARVALHARQRRA